jgi:L-aspartate oxidase
VVVRVSADFVIIGSGIAGLRAAIELAEYGRVVILTKSDRGAGSTGYAQGGIAAAIGADDSAALHAADTLAAGDGLCDQTAVEVLVSEGPTFVRELLSWGVAFDRTAAGSPDLAREGAHSVRRVLHARDATGREIGRTLAARLGADSPSLTVIDHATAVQAIVEDGVARGVRFLDAAGATVEARARATLIATGGAGQVYRETTNPAVATGDGVALAYLAGADIADVEFVQFHPTVLSVPGAPRYLLTEALRGEGARLVNRDGEPFVYRYDPAGDLAARDRVSRAIVLESDRTQAPVYLSLAHLPSAKVRERFPAVTALCRKVGLDLAVDKLPVGPAAHYLMGGVVTDLDGRTTVPGLFAAGEVACTGVHGANRLASNSLLEGLVFGGRAGRAMRTTVAQELEPSEPDVRQHLPADRPIGSSTMAFEPRIDEATVRDLMWRQAGVFRSREGLSEARAQLEPVLSSIEAHTRAGGQLDPSSWRLASIALVGTLIVRAAIDREESRGAHSRTDFPSRDDIHWKRRRRIHRTV